MAENIQKPISDDKLWGFMPQNTRCLYDDDVVCFGDVKRCERDEYCMMFEAIMLEVAEKILAEDQRLKTID